MARPGRGAPGGPPDGRDDDPYGDALAAARLLALLREDDAAPPDDLARRVGRRVRDRITLHHLIEVSTRAPLRLLDWLIAPFSRRP